MAGRLTPGLLLREQGQRLIKLALLVAVVAGLVATSRDDHSNHRLPQPFWYSPIAPLTDWFQTAGSVYQWRTPDTELFNSTCPPIAFILLRLTTTPSCNMYDHYGANGLSATESKLFIGSSIGILCPLIYAIIVWALSLDALATMRRWRDYPPLWMTWPRWMTA